MADLRESFPSLELGTGEGVAGKARVEGDAAAAEYGSIGFAFKDSSGNVVLPQLSSSGKIPVTLDVTGNGKKARGTATGSTTFVTVASLTLAASKVYDDLDFIVSCFRDSIFQVILSDNAVETIVAEALCGPGQFTFHGALKAAEISSGATGTQLLLIKAKNLNAAALSDFRAALSVTES